MHDPSYGDKAIEKLKAHGGARPSVDSQKDQLMWWQLTAVQVISELQYTKAVNQLITSISSRRRRRSTLGATIQFALLKMAQDGRAGAHQGPQRAATRTTQQRPRGFEDKAMAIGASSPTSSRPSGARRGRDAVLAALPGASTDTARTELAQALVQMPERPARRAGVPRRVQEALVGRERRASRRAQAAHRARAAVGQVLRPKMLDWLAEGVEGRARLQRAHSCSSKPPPS